MCGRQSCVSLACGLHAGAVADAVDAVPVESVVLAPRAMCCHARGHLAVSARLPCSSE